MKLTDAELEFLSAWAREEWEPACYALPAHRLQLAHRVVGADLIMFIKAWTEVERKKDQEILNVAANPEPRWPWPRSEDFTDRLAKAAHAGALHRGTLRKPEPGNFEGKLIPGSRPAEKDEIEKRGFVQLPSRVAPILTDAGRDAPLAP